MPSINPDDLDKVFEWSLTTDPSVYLCSQEPTTYTQATSTYALANKLSWIGNIGPRVPTGRQLEIAAITSSNPGTVTASGTATYWAVVDADNSILRATGELDEPIVLVSGSTFTLPPFAYGIAQAITG
jgi:hypothetical protein